MLTRRALVIDDCTTCWSARRAAACNAGGTGGGIGVAVVALVRVVSRGRLSRLKNPDDSCLASSSTRCCCVARGGAAVAGESRACCTSRVSPRGTLAPKIASAARQPDVLRRRVRESRAPARVRAAQPVGRVVAALDEERDEVAEDVAVAAHRVAPCEPRWAPPSVIAMLSPGRPDRRGR